MLRILIVFLMLFPLVNTYAQHLCPTADQVHQLSPNPHIDKAIQDQLDQIWIWHQEKNQDQAALSAGAPLLTVPVVFHIITLTGTGLSDAVINRSLDYLNDAFRNRGFYDPSVGADVEIEFCLARRDPNGTSSTGINRLNDALSTVIMESEDLSLKNLIRWDPRDYLNIWVVDEITSASLGSGVAGYATFPSTHGGPTDGIVLEARFTGSSEEMNSVLTHEAGHYFGLYHTFEGGCQNDDCMSDGDRVCDTPPDQSTGYAPCAQGMNTCQTDANSGLPSDMQDMISNYMDYSRLECYNQFTPLQKDRMRLFLETSRRSLLESQGCADPCNTNITATINAGSGPYVVCDSIDLNGFAPGATNFEWFINRTFYKNGPSVKGWFDLPGVYEIILRASNADGSCIGRDTVEIEVKCPFDLELLTVIDPCYSSGSPITLEIDDVGGANVEWFLGSQRLGVGTVLNYPFGDGGYRVLIKVDDGKCKDSLTVTILVGCKEICGNGFDDDNDGLYDCFDPDCCDECQDHYFQACSESYEDCLPTQTVSGRMIWETTGQSYNPVFTAVCGDVDGGGDIEIVTWSFDDDMVLLAADGSIKRVIGRPGGKRLNWTIPIAMADIEGDGTAEIFYMDLDNELVCIEHDGTLRWSTNPVNTPTGFFQWDPVHVIDANLDGNPEVVIGYNMYDASTGALISTIGAPVQYSFPGGHYVFADILEDGACADCAGLELINGSQVVSISDDNTRFTVVTSHNFDTEGNAGIADWDLDGDLDVVGIGRSRIIVWDGQTNSIIANVANPYAKSTPVIANLDSDPEPEFVMTGFGNWFIYAFDNNLQEMWQQEATEPSAINPICFDFHYDGISDIIIRDNSRIRILEGSTGDELFSDPCESITNDERPLIADIDGDGHAEIVVHCAVAGSALFGTVRAYEGDHVEWPKTRPVMHTYANFQMGINDDLTIPTYAQNHHLPSSIQDLNSSMTQINIPAEPDTLEYAVLFDSIWCGTDGSLTARLTICNSGLSQRDSIDISIYNGSPLDAATQRTQTVRVEVTTVIQGDCITIDLSIDNVQLFTNGQACIIINDPGTRALPFDFTDNNGFDGPGECGYLNNIVCPSLPNDQVILANIPNQKICGSDSILVSLNQQFSTYRWSTGDTTPTIKLIDPGTYWVEVTGNCGGNDRDTFEVEFLQSPNLMLPDTIRSCISQVIQLGVASGFKSYSWQDGRSDSTYTAFTDGIYWVEVVDSCDRVLRDSTVIVLEELADLMLPDTVNICSGDTVTLSVTGHANLSWEPNEDIDCVTCPEVNVYPDTSRWYYVFVNTEEGCFTSDSTFIELLEDIPAFDTTYACAGDSIEYLNVKYGVGEYQIRILNPTGCDTVLTLTVGDLQSDTLVEIIPVCFGDSLFFVDSFYQPGNHVVFKNGGPDCDTVFRLMVTERPDIDAVITVTPSCPGDSTGTAMVTPTTNGTRLILNWSGGDEINDSTAANFKPGDYAVIVIDDLNCSKRFTFTIDTIVPADYSVNISVDSCASGGGINLSLTGQVSGRLVGANYDEEGVDFQDLEEGQFNLSITDSMGCFINDTILILDNPVSFSYDILDTVKIDIGETANVPITGDISQLVTARWLDENGLLCRDCEFLEANPFTTTTYEVELIDAYGCLHILTIVVEVDGFINVYVPNSFSPNGDNINDNFRPFPSIDGLILDEFEVYSRWGELVYREQGVIIEDAIGWDGSFNDKVLPTGVFVYKLIYSIGENQESRTGSVTLIR